jgi:hypothetical protein
MKLFAKELFSSLPFIFIFLILSSLNTAAIAKPKCVKDAGECAAQDQLRKKAEKDSTYPDCLSTHGGSGCRGKTPDAPLPPKKSVPIELPKRGDR